MILPLGEYVWGSVTFCVRTFGARSTFVYVRLGFWPSVRMLMILPLGEYVWGSATFCVRTFGALAFRENVDDSAPWQVRLGFCHFVSTHAVLTLIEYV